MRALLSLPNLLTCVRIALTPVIVLALIASNCKDAFWLSLLAGLTDTADGYLARRMGHETRVGAYLDPIADKILLTALYLCFGVADLVPWWLVGLVVGRDLMILSLAGAGLLWKGIRDFPPTIWGKLSTLLQIATSLSVISGCAYSLSPALINCFLYATAIATAWSGLHYLGRAVIAAAAVSS
jgi:cardiolipin synthase